MKKHTVTLVRDATSPAITNNSVGTDAHNAISTIPHCENIELTSEDETSATVSFTYPDGANDFQETENHLSRFGLKKKS